MFEKLSLKNTYSLKTTKVLFNSWTGLILLKSNDGSTILRTCVHVFERSAFFTPEVAMRVWRV